MTYTPNVSGNVDQLELVPLLVGIKKVTTLGDILAVSSSVKQTVIP